MGKIIGIDLGTTNCCAAVIVDDKPVVIPNSQGTLITPSVVSFEDDGTCLVGEPARRRAILHPLRTIYSVKRFMGESYDGTKDLAESVPYRVGRGQYHNPQFDGGTSWLTPQEVSAEILRTIKHNAEEYLGTPVDEAVITVPAYFNDLQRQATKTAGEMAGFKVRRIISEPTAAAMAYGLDKKIRDERIAVFHLGGGTFDISILTIGDGVYEVESTCGNTHLGGDDFDKAIVDWLAEEFKRDHNIDLRQDPTAFQRLREAAEKAKIELSSSMETDINLPFIATVDGVPQSLVKTITRAHFESLCDKLLAALEQPCRSAMVDATRNSEIVIRKVLLVGGGTRIPAVQKKIGGIFGMEPSKNVNPDEAVAIGAAIQGSIIHGEMGKTLLLDVNPLSLGIETLGGVMKKIIDANTTIPTKKTQSFTTTVDNQTEVHLRVLQGERPMANDNKTIARVTLKGITPAPKGVPQIEVSFDIDANSILWINAFEKTTGKNINVRVESGENITEEDFRRSSDYYAQPSFSSSTASSTSGSSSSNNQSNTSDTSSSNTRTSSQSNQRSSHSSFTPAYRYTPVDSWWRGIGLPLAGILLLGILIAIIFSSLHACDDQEVSQNVSYESSYTPSYESTSSPSYESTTYPSNKSNSYPYYIKQNIISLPEPIKHLFPGLSSSFYITCPSVIDPAYMPTPMDSLLKASQKLDEFYKKNDEMLKALQKRDEMLRVRRSTISTDTLSSNPYLFQWRKNHLQLKTPSLHADPASSIHHDYEIKPNNLNEQLPVDDNEAPAEKKPNSTDTASWTPSTI